VETSQSLFTAAYSTGQTLSVPVAHHDGNYFADDATLDRLEERGQIAFRYCNENGEPAADANPNGSARNIAGVFNDTKNVLGLMPHPENAIDPLLGSTDGKPLFDGLLVQALGVTLARFTTSAARRCGAVRMTLAVVGAEHRLMRCCALISC
jgi:phosphoribosylformylglycinamidine synthase